MIITIGDFPSFSFTFSGFLYSIYWFIVLWPLVYAKTGFYYLRALIAEGIHVLKYNEEFYRIEYVVSLFQPNNSWFADVLPFKILKILNKSDWDPFLQNPQWYTQLDEFEAAARRRFGFWWSFLNLECCHGVMINL